MSRRLPATAFQRCVAANGGAAGRDNNMMLVAFRVRGPLNDGVAARAIEALASRHDALRTTLHRVGGRIEQVVSDTPRIRLDHVRVSASAELVAHEHADLDPAKIAYSQSTQLANR